MKIVNDYGELYKMTDKSYRLFLIAGADGENPNPADYGKRFGYINFHTKDAREEEYENALENL